MKQGIFCDVPHCAISQHPNPEKYKYYYYYKERSICFINSKQCYFRWRCSIIICVFLTETQWGLIMFSFFLSFSLFFLRQQSIDCRIIYLGLYQVISIDGTHLIYHLSLAFQQLSSVLLVIGFCYIKIFVFISVIIFCHVIQLGSHHAL